MFQDLFSEMGAWTRGPGARGKAGPADAISARSRSRQHVFASRARFSRVLRPAASLTYRGRAALHPHPRPGRRVLRRHRSSQHGAGRKLREGSNPAMSTLAYTLTDSATM